MRCYDQNGYFDWTLRVSPDLKQKISMAARHCNCSESKILQTTIAKLRSGKIDVEIESDQSPATVTIHPRSGKNVVIFKIHNSDYRKAGTKIPPVHTSLRFLPDLPNDVIRAAIAARCEYELSKPASTPLRVYNGEFTTDPETRRNCNCATPHFTIARSYAAEAGIDAI